MASKSRKLRAAIKAILEPAMTEAGFTVDYPDFRRADGDILDLVELQYWSYGGGFVIEMARIKGPFKGNFSPLIPREMLEVGHIPFDQRSRLGKTGKSPMRTRKAGSDASIRDDRPALDALIRSLVEHAAADGGLAG